MLKLILSLVLLTVVFYAGFTVGQLTNDLTVEQQGGEIVLEVDLTTLTETQRSGLRAIGITEDTFVITSETLACAEQKLGQDRLDEIKEGDMPTFGETLLLIKCY